MPPELKENATEMIRTLGFPVVACCALGWVMFTQMNAFTSRFDKMLDHQTAVTDASIERGNVAMERSNTIISALDGTLKDNAQGREDMAKAIEKLSSALEQKK